MDRNLIRKLKYYSGTGYNSESEMPINLTTAVSITEPDRKRIAKSYKKERIAELSGSHGNLRDGSPVEVDVLLLSTEREDVSIKIFNRGITLLMRDNEEMRRLHRFIGVLEKELGGGP